MTITGKVESAPIGAIGFDTAVPLTAATAQAYARQGFQFCVRYVSRTPASHQSNAANGLADISEAEGKLILASGMALMVVQHVAGTGWVPTPQLGKDYGSNAVTFAKAAGVPAGLNLWLDLENIPKGTAAADIIAYANEWFAQVAAAGYVPAVYIGFNVWLTPDQLFFDLKTQHYWRAAGNITDVSHRGYQMFQHTSSTNGVEFDKDVVMYDSLGGAPLWLAPA
jgi:hypothetical protein